MKELESIGKETLRISRRLAELYNELDSACKTIANVKPAIDKLEDEFLELTSK